MVGSRQPASMAGVRDRLGGLLGEDGGDPRWRDRLDDLLYEGESIEESVTVGDARVVVTSHRLLSFAPHLDGPNFRQVDRPNVLGVSTGARSDTGHLVRGVRWTAIGLVLVLAGTFLDMDDLVGGVDLGGGAGGQIGVGGVLGVVRSMLDLLRQLDELLQLFGALALLLGVVVFGVYLRSREPTIVVEIAGDEDDVHLPRPEDARAIVDRLAAAVGPDGATPGTDRGTDPIGDG